LSLSSLLLLFLFGGHGGCRSPMFVAAVLAGWVMFAVGYYVQTVTEYYFIQIEILVRHDWTQTTCTCVLRKGFRSVYKNIEQTWRKNVRHNFFCTVFAQTLSNDIYQII
jgi:hypothetical protein